MKVLLLILLALTGSASSQEIADQIRKGRTVELWLPLWQNALTSDSSGLILTMEEGQVAAAKVDQGPSGKRRQISRFPITAAEVGKIEHWLHKGSAEAQIPPKPAKEEADMRPHLIVREGDLIVGQTAWEMPKEMEPDEGDLSAEMLTERAWLAAMKEEACRPMADLKSAASRYLTDTSPIIAALTKAYAESDSPDEALVKPLKERLREMRAPCQETLARAVCHAKRAELLRLDANGNEEDAKANPGKYFQIYPMLSSGKFPEDQLPKLLAGLHQSLLTRSRMTPYCYSPHHAIRLFGPDDELLYEGSICIQCSKFTLTWPGDDQPSLVESLGPVLRAALEEVDAAAKE